MKFSDIDFSAISRMMDNMSDEEKNKLNDMAQNMMNNMKQNEEPEEETDFYEALNINEEDYADFPGSVLDQIEAGSDLEVYYEDVKDADFSASALFYEEFGTPEGWMELKNALQQIYIILNRAEYDFVSHEDLQLLKDILFNQEVLLKIKNL